MLYSRYIWLGTFRDFKNFLEDSRSPLMINDTIPLKPLHCFLANSCCGCDGRPTENNISLHSYNAIVTTKLHMHISVKALIFHALKHNKDTHTQMLHINNNTVCTETHTRIVHFHNMR